MSLPVEFLSGADAELQQIFNRFEDYRDGFGVEFLTVVDAYLARIVRSRSSKNEVLSPHQPKRTFRP
jgi:hypothetical protein